MRIAQTESYMESYAKPHEYRIKVVFKRMQNFAVPEADVESCGKP